MSNKSKEGVYLIKQQCFSSYDEGLKALNNQRKILLNIISKYSCGGFVMGLSECDSDLARKINIRQGKVGRPKTGFTNVCNPKMSFIVKPHIHLYICGLNAASVARDFVVKMNAQYHKLHPNNNFRHAFSQVKRKDGKFSLDYVTRQSRNIRYGGNLGEIQKYVNDK